MEFREFSNPEEEDYDIKASLKTSSNNDEETENNYFDSFEDIIPDDIPEDIEVEEYCNTSDYTAEDVLYGSDRDLLDRHR